MACWGEAMAGARKKRRNHGQSVTAADLADKAIRAIVPADRLRLVRLEIAWADAMPEHVARVAAPVGFDGTTLVVHVLDNQWLHELQYLRSDLLDRVRLWDGGPIAAIRFRVGDVVPMTAAPERPVVLTTTPLPAQPASETLAAIAEVENDDLRGAIATARQALTGVSRSPSR